MTNPTVSRAPRNNPDHWEEHVRLAQLVDVDKPQGIVAYQNGTVAGAALSSTPLTLFTLTNVAIKANRFYLITFIMRSVSSAGTAGTWNLQITANGGLICSTHGYLPTNHGWQHCTWSQPYILTSDTTVTFVATMTGPAGSLGYYDHGGQLRIEDKGKDRGRQ